MFINEAYAAGQAAAGGSAPLSGVLIQLGLILLIFYIFLIRPQQKKIKAHSDMVNALKAGDKVLTNGGIYGKITKVSERDVSLEVAPGTVIRLDRMSVAGLAPEETAAKPAADKASKKKDNKNK